MSELKSAEQAIPPAAEPNPKDQIHDLDAEPAPAADTGDEQDAKGTEAVNPEDTEAKAEDPDKTESSEDSGEDKSGKESRSAKRRAQERNRVAAIMAENEVLRRLVPKGDDAAQLQSEVERRLGPPPKESEFSDYLEFSEERGAYKAAKRIEEVKIRQEITQATEQRKQADADLNESFKERVDEARGRIKDFDSVLNAANVVDPKHPDVARLILSSDKAPELAYYLCKNPKVVHRLNEMPPMSAAAEIGRIEASLSHGCTQNCNQGS